MKAMLERKTTFILPDEDQAASVDAWDITHLDVTFPEEDLSEAEPFDGQPLLEEVIQTLQDITPRALRDPSKLPGYVSEDHWLRAYWHRVVSGLDPVKPNGWRELPPRHVGLRVHCPTCDKKLFVVGLDRDLRNDGSDTCWIKTYRRVQPTWKGLWESRVEGRYEAEHRLDVECPTPGCRGNVSWAIRNIAVALHRLRKELHGDARDVIVVKYLP